MIGTGELFPADKRRKLEAGRAISSGDWLKLGGAVCNLQSPIQLHNGVRANSFTLIQFCLLLRKLCSVSFKRAMEFGFHY
jgi:hypothetical protein